MALLLTQGSRVPELLWSHSHGLQWCPRLRRCRLVVVAPGLDVLPWQPGSSGSGSTHVSAPAGGSSTMSLKPLIYCLTGSASRKNTPCFCSSVFIYSQPQQSERAILRKSYSSLFCLNLIALVSLAVNARYFGRRSYRTFMIYFFPF